MERLQTIVSRATSGGLFTIFSLLSSFAVLEILVILMKKEALDKSNV